MKLILSNHNTGVLEMLSEVFSFKFGTGHVFPIPYHVEGRYVDNKSKIFG
jgi:hypothetical protein